jgi:alkanesulfonate monooxygenase SsuD/methylene tetrahydromethanopterin reductase-like flavin-dependent oxidoreductase (luciferase family)
VSRTDELKVGITAPRGFETLDATTKQALLRSIADAGIDHLFTADHVSFHNGSGMDGIVHLAALSGIEPRLDLHVGVFLLALRHPMVAARQITTLATAAPGRLTVGIGVGGEDRHEFEVCDVDPKTRGRRTDVAVDIVRRLLDGETVDGDGEFYGFTEGKIRPTPTERVPFLVGGRSNAAIDRAARFGDGWLAAWCSARRFVEGIERVHEQGADRDVTWSHGLQLWVGVGDNPEDGRANVADTMGRFYNMPFEPFERYTPVGNAEQIAEFLAPYVESGAATINLNPCGPDPAQEIETIAEVKRLLSNG